MSVLHTLHRLRQNARRESEVALLRAQAERDAQAAKVLAMQEHMRVARDAVNRDDPTDLAAWHAWRLRAEMEERREQARLAQRERDLDTAMRAHHKLVRDEISMEKLLEAHAERARVEALRKETRMLDEVGARRRFE